MTASNPKSYADVTERTTKAISVLEKILANKFEVGSEMDNTDRLIDIWQQADTFATWLEPKLKYQYPAYSNGFRKAVDELYTTIGYPWPMDSQQHGKLIDRIRLVFAQYIPEEVRRSAHLKPEYQLENRFFNDLHQRTSEDLQYIRNSLETIMKALLSILTDVGK